MKMWCHLPTGFKRRYVLQFVVLASIIVALFTTLIFAHATMAALGTNKTISFQGRLSSAAGAVVPDGYYNIQFKIYQDGSGTAAGNPDGSLKWTETHVNNNTNGGVQVKNGYFSVSLGSKNPFGTSVDWNQDTLWLSMNIAGSASACSTFGSAPCTADGEMLPMKQMTSTPYAMNAGAVGGKSADNFVQLAQGVQTDTSTNTSSIYINKTGSGNLVQLQNNGSDVFSVTNAGNIQLGSGSNQSITVGSADPNANGGNLSVRAGDSGSGTGGTGGSLLLEGGDAKGTNGSGGDVTINGGALAGSGNNGSIFIGASKTDTIQIGSSGFGSGNQTIEIGNNDGGGTTNVTIGSNSGATAGDTRIQAKNNTVIATDGVDRATFGSDSTLSLGNGVSSNAPSDFKIQGTSSSASGINGGALTVQGGNTTTGDANGGNLNLKGGSGSGSGVSGLVVMNTPTYETASTQTSAVSANITQTNIDSFGVVTLNATAADVTFTLGAPSLGSNATGRLIYVTAANGSQNFMLRANTGAGNGVEQNVAIRQNMTVPMIWNGTLWTTVGAPSATDLQASYDNTAQPTGGAELYVKNGAGADGLTIRDSSTNPVNGPLLEVQTSSAGTLFSINSNINEFASNPGAEKAGNTVFGFPENTWGAANSSSISQHTTAGDNIASGQASVRISSSAPVSGVYNILTEVLPPSKTYNVSFAVRLDSTSNPLTDLAVYYAADGVNPTATCTEGIIVTASAWKKINCSFQTPASGMNSDNLIAIVQKDSTDHHVFYVDNLSVTPAGDSADIASPTANVQIGGGNKGGSPTLFTLDKNASAPGGSGAALLGSMYYDTTLGKVQCYEADGWGGCGASPDSFVTLSPEYSNAVMHGSGTGDMNTDLCSDTLNINDGSSSQPTICGTNETFNFYKWTSNETTDQTRSIFVTYQLPSSFKQFIPGTTSLMGRTDSDGSKVEYQVYRNNSSGLSACGSVVPVSTGSKTTWQKASTVGGTDPSNCNFTAGDNIVIRINMTAKDDAKAYVSNLGFTFSNQ